MLANNLENTFSSFCKSIAAHALAQINVLTQALTAPVEFVYSKVWNYFGIHDRLIRKNWTPKSERGKFSSGKKHSESKKETESSAINNKIEHLLYQKKVGEIFNLLAETSNFAELNSSTLCLLFDFLNESNNVNTAFEIMKLMIYARTCHLSKYIIKSFFFLCGKAGQSNLASYICQLLEGALKRDLEEECPSYPPELLHLTYQYFTFTLVKCGEFENAISTLESYIGEMKNVELSKKPFLKSIEIIFKALVKNDSPNSQAKISALFLLLKDVEFELSEIYFNKLIDFASKNDAIKTADQIYQLMKSIGVKPSIVTFNTLIDSYFKHKMSQEAWNLFEELKISETKPDNFTYTTMINGIKRNEIANLDRAFSLFEEYKVIAQPDQIIYNCLLDACVNSNQFEMAVTLLSEMKKSPETIKLDEITYNTLIKGCCKNKQVIRAINFYDEMRESSISPNRITYNSLIDTCVKTGKMNMVWKFYDEMIKENIRPDNFTYSILINGIKTCSTRKEDLYKTLQMHSALKECGEFQPDEILYNSMIDACVKFNELDKAFELFKEMSSRGIKPSSITYGILIKAYGKSNNLEKAFKIFEIMKNENITINDVTYGCLMDACVKNDQVDMAVVLLNRMREDKIPVNTVLMTTLIKGFSRQSRYVEAMKVFEAMKTNPRSKPNLITYNCILDSCVRGGQLQKAISLFEEMDGRVRPDLITYSTLIKGCCRSGNVKLGATYLDKMVDSNVKPDEAIFNLLMDACLSNSNCELSLEIFAKMKDMNVRPSAKTFGLLIKTYGFMKKLSQALSVLPLMGKMNIAPSLFIYTSLLQVCFNCKKIDKALFLYEKIQQEGLKLDSVCYNKLVAGSLKCSRIELAYSFYEKSVSERQAIDSVIRDRLISELKRSPLENKQKMLDSLYATKSTKGLSVKPQSNYSQSQSQSQSSSRFTNSKKVTPFYASGLEKENIPINTTEKKDENSINNSAPKKKVREFNPFMNRNNKV